MKRLLFVIPILCAIGCGDMNSHVETIPCKITEKAYSPASNGTGFTSKGNIVITSNDASYSVIFTCPDGESDLKEIDKAGYLKTKIGDIIYIEKWVQE